MAPSLNRLPGPALYRCNWLLFSGAWSQGGCRILGGPRARVGSLVGGVKVLKTLGLLPTPWQVKSDPGVSARLLAGRAGSWNLAAGLRDSRARFKSLVDWGRFLTQLGVGSGVS